VTSFQVAVFAHTLDGRLGAGTKLIESRLPFTLASKVPVEVTSTDRLEIPVAVSNNTTLARQVDLSLSKNTGLEVLAGKSNDRFDVPAEGRTRRLVTVKPTMANGVATLGFLGKTEPFAADGIVEHFKVVPDGFPVSGSSSDLLEKSAT